MRITGADGGRIQADEALPPPSDLSEQELDLLDDTCPPDPARAQAWWGEFKDQFAQEGRWQSGQEISTSPLAGSFAVLPLQSRRDLFLGTRASNPDRTPDLELERRSALQQATPSLSAPSGRR